MAEISDEWGGQSRVDADEQNDRPALQTAVPMLGTVISGRALIAYTPIREEYGVGDGIVPHGVGIAMDTRPNAYHPYVVWTIYTHDAGRTWGAESGDYCLTLSEAVERMTGRGGEP